MESTKRILGIFLILLVLFFTALVVLSIWDIVSIERIMNKSFKTLFVLFVSTFVILFISNVLLKPADKRENTSSSS